MRPAIVAALILLGATAAGAQEVVVSGTRGPRAAAALHEIVERGSYRVLDRDTILPAGSLESGDLVVIDAIVRLEGAVSGSVAVVGGSLFLRPGARVGGLVAAVEGTLGMSRLATLGDSVTLPVEYSVRVERVEGQYRVDITAPPRPPLLTPSGLFGIVVPAYDRVNGVTVRIGVGGSFGTDSLRPRYQVTGSYYSARGAVGASGELRFPLGGRAYLGFGGGREVRTREAWIRGDLANSVSALLVRSDVRNYFQSDFGTVVIEQGPPPTLDRGRGFMVPRVRLTASRDRSLEASNPWSLFGNDPWRANPGVFEGTLTSVSAGFAAGHRGMTSQFAAEADLEWAFPSPVGRDWGERTFVQVVADADWGMLALWNHTLDVRAHAQQTFGPDPAPGQRWSILGGPGTLPTLPQGSLRGDNLVFFESTYSVPVPRVTLPIVGIPALAARHAVGSAWVSDGDTPRWEQNLALGVRFRAADFFLYLDPSEADRDPHFSFGVTLPF